MSEPVYPLHGPDEEKRLQEDKERRKKEDKPAAPAQPPAEPEKE